MRVVFFLLVLSFYACRTNKEISSTSYADELQKIAYEKYGNRYTLYPNDTDSYTLVKKKTKRFSEMGFDIDYFIFSHVDMRIIIEDTLRSGHVEWISDKAIKVVNRKKDPNNKGKLNKEVYLYDVIKKEKNVLKD